MEGLLWVLIALPVYGFLLYFLSEYFKKRCPELNLGLVAFGAGILIGLMILFRGYINNPVVLLSVYSVVNILVGWLITRTGFMRKLRDFLGSRVGKIGTYTTQDGRPTYYVLAPGMGEAIKTPMKIKSRRALHGLLSSFFASFVLFFLPFFLSIVDSNIQLTIIELCMTIVLISFFPFLGG